MSERILRPDLLAEGVCLFVSGHSDSVSMNTKQFEDRKKRARNRNTQSKDRNFTSHDTNEDNDTSIPLLPARREKRAGGEMPMMFP